jgi:hypothetical protein
MVSHAEGAEPADGAADGAAPSAPLSSSTATAATAAVATAQLRAVLDVVRRLYGVTGGPDAAAAVPARRDETRGPPRRPTAVLWLRGGRPNAGGDESGSGYEVVVDATLETAPSSTDDALAAVRALLARSYSTLGEAPVQPAPSPVSPSLPPPPVVVFRVRPTLVIAVRALGGGRVEVAWKPVPVEGGAPGVVGLTTEDIAAVGLLFGVAAREWRAAVTAAPPAVASAAAAAPSSPPADIDHLHALVRSAALLAGTAPAVNAAAQGTFPPRPQAAAAAAPPQPDLRLEDFDDDDADEGVPAPAGQGSGAQRGAPGAGTTISPRRQPLRFLKSQGIRVYSRKSNRREGVDWTSLAGYADIQREVEDAVLLPMQHPGVFAAVAGQTRVRPEPITHGAFLFSGPPGTGKTTTARVIASLTDVPLVVLDFEHIGSPYFSASEGNFARVLEAVSSLDGAVLVVDEAEAMFPSRGGGGEALGGGGGGGGGNVPRGTTADIGNKLLAQMLKFLEGMQGSSGGGGKGGAGSGSGRTSVIFATNRPESLDSALLSRVSSTVPFHLPTPEQRAAIWRVYARHLDDAAIAGLVEDTEGWAGRDVKRACEVVERRHAAALLRAGAVEGAAVTPPPTDLYERAIDERWEGVLSMAGKGPVGAGGGRHSRGGGGGGDAGGAAKRRIAGSRRHREGQGGVTYKRDRVKGEGGKGGGGGVVQGGDTRV